MSERAEEGGFRVGRHYHRYTKVGPAPAFGGLPCVKWKCECGKTIELFENVQPPTNSWAKA